MPSFVSYLYLLQVVAGGCTVFSIEFTSLVCCRVRDGPNRNAPTRYTSRLPSTNCMRFHAELQDARARTSLTPQNRAEELRPRRTVVRPEARFPLESPLHFLSLSLSLHTHPPEVTQATRNRARELPPPPFWIFGWEGGRRPRGDPCHTKRGPCTSKAVKRPVHPSSQHIETHLSE